MKAAHLTLALVAAALAGCSGGSGLSTGSLFGSGTSSITTGSLFGSSAKPAATAPVNDPAMRAFQVGTVSARAVKCGFNFDPAKLKTDYLAYERTMGSTADDLAKLEKVYDASFNGIAKAVSGESDYCTPEKTKTIKADLARHLAGDYTPSPMPKAAPEDGGLLSGWGFGSGGDDGKGYKATLPTDNSNI
jgi:hypothetical protein